jgi:peptide/nickel transport system substrate-binding protein
MHRLPALIVMALIVLLTGCTAQGPVTQTANEGRIVYGLTLSPSGFDPHIHQSSEIGIVLRQVYDTLIYRQPDTGQFVAGLASEWTISPDGLIYEFKLKQGVRFHDGTPFNAQAVSDNLSRIMNPATRSQQASLLLGTYTGHEVVDDYTIRLLLSEPFSPLLDGLSQFYLGMASPKALTDFPAERYQFNQVGTGPYRFVEYIPDNRVVIRRNTDYSWGPGFYAAPDNPISEVEFRFFTDPATRLNALESGDVDIMGEIPPTDARALTGSGQIQLIPSAVGGQPEQLIMNTQRFPTDNLTVRRALIYATSRQAISDLIFQGFSPVAWAPLAERTQFYSSELRGLYENDVQQARALLASVGFADNDQNGYFDVEGGDLEVIVLVPPWGENRQITQLLQDQWRSAGIRVTLRPVPDFATLIEEVAAGEFNLVPFNTYGLDPAFLSSYFTTGATRNFARVSSIDLDNQLADARRQLDPAARSALYGNAQRIIMEQALVLPLRDRVNLNGVSPRIIGLRFDAFGWYPLLYNASLVR